MWSSLLSVAGLLIAGAILVVAWLRLRTSVRQNRELKALVDDAHGLGLRVVTDLVHSHSVRNEVEGLSRFDGTTYQYFHEGPRGEHSAWDSRCSVRNMGRIAPGRRTASRTATGS